MHHVGRMLVCAIWGELAAGLQSPPAAGVPSWLHGSGVLNLRDLHYPNHPLEETIAGLPRIAARAAGRGAFST